MVHSEPQNAASMCQEIVSDMFQINLASQSSCCNDILLAVEPTVIRSMRIVSNSTSISGLVQMHVLISPALICR